MSTVTTGTVLATPIDEVLYTGTAALGSEVTTETPPVPASTITAAPCGHYRPLTWPSYGRPWRL